MTKYTLAAGFTHSGVNIDDAAASTYTVNLDSYIIDEDTDSTALNLTGGVWTVTLNGGVSAFSGDGLFIGSPVTGTANSKVTVGTEGSVYGSNNGIAVWGATDVTNSGIIRGESDGIVFDGHTGTNNFGPTKKILVDNKTGASIIGQDFGIDNYSAAALTVKNAGTISANHGEFAIRSDGLVTLTNSGEINGSIGLWNTTATTTGNSVTNTGTIDGTIQIDYGKTSITNSGAIYGRDQYWPDADKYVQISISLWHGSSTIKNTNEIDGTIVGSDGADVVTNSGTIWGATNYGHDDNSGDDFQVSVDLLDGNDSLTNSGEIDGDVWVGVGNDTVTNSGKIYGYIDGWEGDDQITNTGYIYSGVGLGEGVNKLTNSKEIDGSVSGGDGGNTISNKGSIYGDIDLGGGNDVVTNTDPGRIYGDINLGAGDDSFTDGKGSTVVFDDAGNDKYGLGAGNDTYYASADNGIDKVDGGTGTDYYEATDTGGDYLHINLGTTATTSINGYVLAGGTATFSDAGTGKDGTLTGFEVVDGSSGSDIIIGGTAAETLYGNNGADIIGGGGGADKLWGGDGADKFVLLTPKDSGATRATRDTVMDFDQGQDQIDLSYLDGNTTAGAAGIQTFGDLIGNDAFSGSAGEVRYVWQGGQTIIEGDTNGDKKADFSIALQGQYTLTSDDFVGLTG